MEFFDNNYLRTAIGFVLGSIIGSFLNVCVTRIPQGVSIIVPGSACPMCSKKINWFNNLPIISWMLLKGSASCCEFKIPFRYFLVELSTALIFGFLFYEDIPDLFTILGAIIITISGIFVINQTSKK